MRLRVLVVMVLGAGCGRLGFDDRSPIAPGGDDGPPASLAPQVCGVQTYSTITLPRAIDLSVAATPGGAAVFAVPSAGGALAGFAVDQDGTLTRPLATVRAGMFTASAAAYVDSTLITAVVSSSRTLVNIVPMDLSSYSEIANVDGEHVGKQALLHASADRITPTVCSSGLTVNPFDPAWKPTTAQVTVTTAQTTAVAATPIGSEALVAFSTASTCYVERLANQATGTGSSQAFSCLSPRLANDGSLISRLLFEAGDGIRMASITADQLGDRSDLVVEGGTSPRIVFDGQRYWASYLDATGTVIVGVVSGTSLITAQVSGVTPAHDAYELALVNGAPWVFAVDAGGVSAHKLCLGT